MATRRKNKTSNSAQAQRIRRLLRRASEANARIHEANEAHRELDACIEALRAEGFTRGHGWELNDAFAHKNVAWKSAPFRRYALERAP